MHPELLQTRRLVASAAAARPDLLVHALAQLPDEVELALAPSPRLELLARAYGIAERVHFDGAAAGDAVAPYATMAELVESLARPDDAPASAARSGLDLDGQRVAVITNIPAPYRIPLFAALHERLAAEGASFRVFFCSDSSERSWMNASAEGFDHEVLSSFVLPIRRRRAHVPADLERRLAAFRPTLVLAAGLSPLVAGRAGWFARRRGVPFGIWSGDIAVMGTARSRMRRVQRQRLLALADFAVVYGFSAGEYLRSLRPDLPFVYARNTSVVDVEPRTELRTGPLELVVVGDLASPRKGIDVALDALGLVPGLDCRLTVVGGGALHAELARTAATDERVTFTGALPPAEVRRRYDEADVFLFPTRADVFGLVLVEAMAAGLASVTASNPGVVGDLAVAGRNCLVVDGHEPAAWAAAIERLAANHDLRARLAQAGARAVANRWTTAHSADAVLAGFRLGLEVRKGGR